MKHTHPEHEHIYYSVEDREFVCGGCSARSRVTGRHRPYFREAYEDQADRFADRHKGCGDRPTVCTCRVGRLTLCEVCQDARE